MSQAPPYMSPSGNVVRDRRRIEYVRPRVLFVVVLFVTLFVTNPANNVKHWMARGNNKSQEESSWYGAKTDTGGTQSASPMFQTVTSLLDTFLSSVQSASDGKRLTNYVLFSLRSDIYDGIYIQAVSNDFLLCRHDGVGTSRFDPLCGWVGDNFCHGMKAFDRYNRPFTAHRILEILLFASVVLLWCSKPGWWPSEPCWRRPLPTLASILWYPSIIEDLIACNMFIYPAFVRMDRLVSIMAPSEGQASTRFYLSACALIFGIGGLCNMVASMMGRKATFGMHGATAASLGYLVATARNQVIIKYMGIVNMFASDILLAITVIGLVDSFFSIRLPVLGKVGRHNLVAWILGGILGNMMGKFQLDRYAAWWYPFR